MKILLANRKIKINANTQIAHLQFAQANAQTKNCKRAIFFQRSKISSIFENIIERVF